MNLFTPEVAENYLDYAEFINLMNLEIHCQGFPLDPQLKLKDVNQKYWEKEKDLLTLYYRNKPDGVKKEIITKVQEKYSYRPSLWVPDAIAFNC